MTRLSKTIIGAGLFLFTTLASGTGYHVEFGPFVGGGKTSSDATVRHISGYALSIDHPWSITDSIYLGPRLELANSFINTKETNGTHTAIATYDNRIFAAGARFGFEVGNKGTLAQEVYINLLGGRSFSKLAVDENDEASFVQNLYGDITGTYISTEIGGWMPLKNEFGLNLALLASSIKADQSGVTGSYEGEEIRKGTAFRLAGRYDADNKTIDDTIYLKTLSLKLGVSLGF